MLVLFGRKREEKKKCECKLEEKKTESASANR